MEHDDQSDAFSRLWWAARRYVGALVAVAIGTAVVAGTATPPPEPETYRASALVVAQQLDGIRPEHFPRMAQAIFDGNNVARSAVEEASLPLTADEVREDHAALDVIEGTVVSRVNGLAEDPRLARDIANAMAEALVAELNRLGPGVGTFALQEAATIPSDPLPRGLSVPPALYGLLSGLVIGAGIVTLIFLLRRPILDVTDARRVSGVPLVGVLALSRAGRFDPLDEVRGVAAVTDRLFPDQRGVAVFVAAERAGPRSQVAVLISKSLSSVGSVRFIACGDRPSARAARALRPRPGVVVDMRSGIVRSSEPTVVDGRGPETLDDVNIERSTILVAEKGVGSRRLGRAVEELLPIEVDGLVWVTPRAGFLRGLWRRLVRADDRASRTDGATADRGTLQGPAGDGRPYRPGAAAGTDRR